jgi:hypothetical protein
MNRMTFLFERFSLIPAFSRWEKENYPQSLDVSKIIVVPGFNVCAWFDFEDVEECCALGCQKVSNRVVENGFGK